MAVSDLGYPINPQYRHLLVVSESARMLAQAARTSGLKPLVIDLHGDQDTRIIAEDFRQVPSLAQAHLMPALTSLTRQYPVVYAVIGSGFERHPDSLKALGDNLILLGNQHDVFVSLQHKPAFFALLETLQIPYPDVSFDRPTQDEGWLVKPMQSQGGVGIRKYSRGQGAEPNNYWQKYQAGEPHSVLFLADGKRSQVVGFNKQWAVSLSNTDEFIFSGVINSTHLSVDQKAKIQGWLDLLVPELSLKGLNSLDFIQSGQLSYVLEINPRPSASMQLYETDLLSRHIKACEGELLDCKLNQTGFAAYQIVYAQADTKIPDCFQWPEDILDRPIAGSIIGAGQPICSIIARGQEPDEVLRQLSVRQEYIITQLDRFQTYGIQRQRQ